MPFLLPRIRPARTGRTFQRKRLQRPRPRGQAELYRNIIRGIIDIQGARNEAARATPLDAAIWMRECDRLPVGPAIPVASWRFPPQPYFEAPSAPFTFMRMQYSPLPAAMNSVWRSFPPKHRLPTQFSSGTGICSIFLPVLSKTVTPRPLR